jgi:NTP pyrophosphatase (non-canonical NTP hydrolase)
MTINFDDLRRANMKRLPLFKDRLGDVCHAASDGSDWRPSDWMTAIVGEVGELAGELKKARRGDYGIAAKESMRYDCVAFNTGLGAHPEVTPDEVKEKIKREAADIVIYLDILMSQFEIDLGEAIAQKFNEVSDRIGVDVQLTGTLE